MKLKFPSAGLTRFESGLWLLSIALITGSFILSGYGDILTLAASLIGATALIYVAKGYVIGQILTVVFSVFYGIISFHFRYYGEMITYLGMTAPIAILTAISWAKHPYKGTKVVEIDSLKKHQVISMVLLSILVTAIFYFILSALGNENIFFSTVSVTTSFIACYLTFLRSPCYALGYAANDIVLIILWILASIEDISYLPMVICFLVFLANDLYGFYNWLRMRSHQQSEK